MRAAAGLAKNNQKIFMDADKVEELSKAFSLKLADKLEGQKIDVEKVCRLMQEFLRLTESAGGTPKIQEFIDRI